VVVIPRANWQIIVDESTKFEDSLFSKENIRWLRQPVCCSILGNIRSFTQSLMGCTMLKREQAVGSEDEKQRLAVVLAG